MEKTLEQSGIFNINIEKIDSTFIKINTCSAYFDIESKILKILAELENTGLSPDYVRIFISVYTKDGVLIDTAECLVSPFSHMATTKYIFENLDSWPYKVRLSPGYLQPSDNSSIEKSPEESPLSKKSKKIGNKTKKSQNKIIVSNNQIDNQKEKFAETTQTKQGKEEHYKKLFKIINKDGKWGFVDKKGNVIVEPKFEEVGYFSEDMCPVKFEGKWGFIDDTGALVFAPQFPTNPIGFFNYFKEELLKIWIDKWLCYFDKNGEIVIKIKNATKAKWFSEGLAPIAFGGKCEEFTTHGDEYITYLVGEKWRYIDKSGQFAFSAEFDDADPFSEGLGKVKINDKYGFIDKKGNIAITPRFDSALQFKEGLACVKISGKHGYIDKTGEFVIPPKFDHAAFFNEGLSRVGINNKYGIIDKRGIFVVEPRFDFIDTFPNNGITEVRLSDNRNVTLHGLMDVKNKIGRFIIQPQECELRSFREGMCPFRLERWDDCKWGYLNNKGEIAVPAEFDEAGSYSEGLASVLINGRWGFINKTGEMVIKPQFFVNDHVDEHGEEFTNDYLWPGFSDGFAQVWLGDNRVYIDKKGNYIWQEEKASKKISKEDEIELEGQVVFAEDGIYEGEYKDGMRHGKGILIYSDGSKYEGEFKEDNFHGKGKWTYSDGNTSYEGDFYLGKRFGKGKLFYSQVGEYVGEFKNNKRHGKGTMTYFNGEKYEGQFENGKFIR